VGATRWIDQRLCHVYPRFSDDFHKQNNGVAVGGFAQERGPMSLVSGPIQARSERSQVFICYRFGDSSYAAARLARDLMATFGTDRIFFDHHSIEGGQEFSKRITSALSRSCVVLVLCGPNWVKAQDEASRRRIDDPEDYVHQEVLMGLRARNEATVVPVVLQDGPDLRKAKLPAPLARLASLNSVRLETKTWEENVRKIAAIIERHGLQVANPPSSEPDTPHPADSDIRELASPRHNRLRALILPLALAVFLASYVAADQSSRALTRARHEALRHLVEGTQSTIEHIIKFGPSGEGKTSLVRQEAEHAKQLADQVVQAALPHGLVSDITTVVAAASSELSWRARLLSQRIDSLLAELREEEDYWQRRLENSTASVPAKPPTSASPSPGDTQKDEAENDERDTARRLVAEARHRIELNLERQRAAKALMASSTTDNGRPHALPSAELRRAAPDAAQQLTALAQDLQRLTLQVADELDQRAAEDAIKSLIRTTKFEVNARVESPSTMAVPKAKWDGYFFLYTSETNLARCLAHGADGRRENELFGNLALEERDIIKRLKNAALKDSDETEDHIVSYAFMQPSTGRKADKVAYAVTLRAPPAAATSNETAPYRSWWIGAGYYEQPAYKTVSAWLVWLPWVLSATLLAAIARFMRGRGSSWPPVAREGRRRVDARKTAEPSGGERSAE
jgi:hypothetical protein